MEKRAILLVIASLAFVIDSVPIFAQDPPQLGPELRGSCYQAGKAWAEGLKPKHAEKGQTVLVFLDTETTAAGGLCYYNRDFGVTGDPIYIGVFTKGTTSWQRVSYDPCAIESAAPNVFTSQDHQPADKNIAKTNYIEKFLPWRCYNGAVTISVVGALGPTAVTQSFPLAQAERYRATVQTGVVFTKSHSHSFVLRKTVDDSLRVHDAGPANEGPEYVASLVFYGLPHYLPFINKNYPGRDIVHEQSVWDRIGGMLGVGLKNPGDRFVAGLTFELLAGINLIAVREYASVERLSGITEGLAFKGSADQIPTTKVWVHHNRIGLSMDLRYATKLFSR